MLAHRRQWANGLFLQVIQLAIGGQHSALLAVASKDAPPPPANPAAAAAAAEEEEDGDGDDAGDMDEGDAAVGGGRPAMPDPWAAAAGA